MPKARTRRKKRPGQASKIAWGGSAGQGTGRLNLALAAAAIAAAAAVAVFWWQDSRAERELLDLAAQGQAALARVQSFPSQGRRHLQPGESHRYASALPTSGPHALIWTKTGFYDETQMPVRLVHALEHGNIVIYYGKPGPETLATLRDWASLYGGQWDGVVVAPIAGMGKSVVLNAWRKELRLERFDPAAAAAFIDAFRGRGPENPVR